MALTSTAPFSAAITSVTVLQTAASNLADGDITGGANLTLTTIELDGATNTTVNTVYLKFYDTGAPVVGTTDPDMVVPMAANTRGAFQISGGGHTFVNAISMACVQEGGTAGTTNPTVSVIVRVTSE
jgi:hypothetical protein